MKIYINGKLIVVETNVAWALPYWQGVKAARYPNIRVTWEFV